MSERVSHPIFARLYARVASDAEARGAAEHRRRMLAGCEGRVLEVGAGVGSNFAHYPAAVTEVIAVEPEPHLRDAALKAAGEAPVPVRVIDGHAGSIPCQDGEFDRAVASLVLCTVPDQPLALAELFRALRPGGELHFYEHVRSHRPREARVQELADATVWPHIAGGCKLSRDTGAGIEQAGFQINACERFAFSPARMMPAAPHILGVARRP
jgi:ubiquinone/menaquinone biosynthesis C-methylase UbiE